VHVRNYNCLLLRFPHNFVVVLSCFFLFFFSYNFRTHIYRIDPLICLDIFHRQIFCSKQTVPRRYLSDGQNHDLTASAQFSSFNTTDQRKRNALVFRSELLYQRSSNAKGLNDPVKKTDLNNPLTTTRATIVAHAFLVITRHLLQLERCSNPLRIQQV